jgi:hypothetical protein
MIFLCKDKCKIHIIEKTFFGTFFLLLFKSPWEQLKESLDTVVANILGHPVYGYHIYVADYLDSLLKHFKWKDYHANVFKRKAKSNLFFN